MTKRYCFFIYSFEHISKIQGIKYLNRCLNNLNKSKIISDFNLLNFKEYPKITVIIPVYNSQNSIKLSLTSVLSQNIPEFEIILINDNSSDNSSIIINEMIKCDNRIKVINNHKNMGTLYSRSIGVLSAKGKYIFALDNDDIFLNENIFKKIYNIAEKFDYDIVEFKAFDIPNYQPEIQDIKQHYFNFHPNNLILHQPELGIFPIFRNNEYFSNDFLIWGKCIRTKLYQMSINILGKKRYSIYNCWTEDISIIIVIFNLANSYIFVNKYGIFHLNSIITSTFTLHQDHKIFSEIYLLEIIIDYLKETEYQKKIVVSKAFEIFNKIENYKLSEVNRKYLDLILQKILICNYLNQNDKKILKQKFSELIKY
jgi:glycosyltransferase involved in cell wall biosynthesis